LADRSHQVCLRTADGTRDEQSKLDQDPLALQSWANALRARFPRERSPSPWSKTKGPLVYALSMHAHLELFPINRHAAKYASGESRERDQRTTRSMPPALRAAAGASRLAATTADSAAAARELQMLLEARPRIG